MQVGERVRYRASFLRSIGAYAGDIPNAKGTITAIENYTTIGQSLATVKWDNDYFIEKRLPNKVLVANLIEESRVHLEPA